MRRKLFAGLLAALVMVSMVATPAAAALAFGDSGAPNPYIDADTTIESYEASWGDDLQYEDDSGEVTSLPATVNSSEDVDDLGSGTVNPYEFTVTDIDFSDAGEFPRKSDEEENSASALDASEWEDSGATTSDVNTAPGVDAVEFDASADGDSASYSNFSVTSDAEKRYLQVFYDVESADASEVTLTINDATDGDTVEVKLYDADGNTSDDAVGASSTGEGKAMQVQVGELSASGGDGTIDEIGSIDVAAAGGAADVDISALNVEKTSKWKIGEQYVETDDGDDLETETVYETTGPVSVNSMDTLGGAFDDATIMGVIVPVHYQASDLSDSDMSSAFEETSSYPGFGFLADIYYKLELPGAYDLSHSNAELKTTTQWPGERYVTVETKEDAGDTEFADIENWNDQTGTHDSQDKDITLDSTIQSDTEYALHYELKLTDGEADSMQQATNGGGAGGLFSTGGGGIIGFLTSIPGIALSAIGGFFGGRKLGVF